jgi:tryptophan 6-halogenase
MSGKSIAPDVGRQALGKGYPIFSWYCLLSGMGVFPAKERLRPANGRERHYNMDEIDNLLTRSAANFRSQREVLADIPQKVHEKSLQIYFW